MGERNHLTIPFGGGLDRESGVLTVQPSAFSDLRNVHLHDGRAELRKGLLQKLSLDGVTDILGIFPARTAGIGVVIAYASGPRTVSLWITSGDVSTTAKVGDLPWTIAAGAVSPPRIFGADSYDKLLIAHDEPNFAYRNCTALYDIGAGTIDNFLSPTLGTVKFRGVYTYLSYMIGWGHGTDTDPDRPEIVRTSLPAEPTNFDINHYFVAGQRGDPVLRCEAAGDVLAVRKQSQSYDIFGYDRSTFGIKPSDRLFGIGGSRLGITVGAVNYFWSLDGPRSSSGGASHDLGLLLDLEGPAVDVAAANLDLDNGFATYVPSRREVLFVFGSWAFVLHIADPSALRWSYRKLAVIAFCAGILYDGGAGIGPEAHAELPFTSSGTEFTLQQDATIIGALNGTDQLEWWVKPYTTNTWAPKITQPIGMATSLTEVLTGLLAGIPYDVAARVKRTGIAAAAYASSNPASWPATSRVVGLAQTSMGDVTAASFVSADDGLGHQKVTITLGDTAFGQVAKQSHVLYEVQVDRGAGFVDVPGAISNFLDGKVIVDMTADLGHTYPMQVRQRTTFGTAFPFASAWSAQLSVTI